MAKVVYVPGAEPPVNDGERRVIVNFERKLPDDYTLYPGLQVIHDNRVDDVDLLVVTPFALVVVEVKDIAGHLHINNTDCYVNEHRRSEPYTVTNSKVRRLKSRLFDFDRRLNDVWVSPLVVLARKPASLQLIPDSLHDFIMEIDPAIAKLTDPVRFPRRDPDRGLGDLRSTVERVLNLHSGRTRNVRYGPYACTELLGRTPEEDLWAAAHEVSGEEVEIRHVGRNPMNREQRVNEARSEYAAFADLREDTRVSGPKEFNLQDDGSAILVYSSRKGPTLEEALEAGDEIPAERVILDVAGALEAAHSKGMFHGRLAPRWIELLPDTATVRGFGRANTPLPAGTALLDSDSSFLAPEVLQRMVPDAKADIFGLGKLVSALKPDDPLMQKVAAELTAAEPRDRKSAKFVREAIALAFEQPETIEQDVPEMHVDEEGRLLPGTVVGNHLVVEHIGSGGFSDVYLVQHKLGGRYRALKLFKGHPRVIEMVRHEFRVLQDINDPNVVRVVDAGESGVGWYMVSEHLEGQTLTEWIDTHAEGTDQSEALLIVSELLNALEQIHGRAVYHRDIKPENVILVKDRGAVLFDFGVAASAESKVDGLTMEYWPPDVPAGSENPDADLFAVGIILCQLLSGKYPYPSGYPRPGEDPDLSEISPDLRSVVAQAVDLDGSERFGSAREFREALGPFQHAPNVPVASMDRYHRAERLIAEGRFDEADSLILEQWTRLRQLLDRKRGAFDPAGARMVGLLVGPEQEAIKDVHRIDNTGEAPATTWTYQVTGTPELMVDVMIAEHDEDNALITTIKSYDSAGRLPELVNRRRVGIRREGEIWLMQLSLTTRPPNARTGKKHAVTLDELSEDAGVDIEQALLEAGALGVGTRKSLGYDEPAQTRNFINVVIPDDKRNEVALLGYLLTTVVPLGREAGLLLDDQE